MKYRYKMIIEYDGTPFHGWQSQKGYDSIQERIENAMIPFFKKKISLHCAGRTDAGVHALAQVAHFDVYEDINSFRLKECMNFYLKEVPISILSLEKVSNNFHARISAVERAYVYKILNRRAKSAIDANRVWNVKVHLDAEKMNEAAKILIGKHDFSSFRAVGCQQKSPIKTINDISVERLCEKKICGFDSLQNENEKGDLIEIKVRAKSFLYHQVRNIVGSLKLVGEGKWSTEKFREILDAKNREKAGPTAPACGLYFLGARYPDEIV